MSDQSLALLKAQVPSPAAMTGMLAVATALVEAGMVPVGIKKPGQALALILTGREMGIGPMRSVQDLYHVGGNVGMLTRFMVAQFRLAGHCHDVLVKTGLHSKVVLHLKEGRDIVIEMTRDEVNRLGYPYYWKAPQSGGPKVKTEKPQWRRDPAGLLYNRNMTRGIRDHAPEVLYGMLTQEEIQDRGIAAGESRLVAFLKEGHPDVWTEWAQIQLREDLVEAAKRDAIEGEARELSPGDEDSGPDAEATVVRPYQPAHVKRLILAEAAKGSQKLAPPRRTGPLCGWLDALFPTDSKEAQTQQRYTLLRFFFDKDTSKKLTDGEVTALAKWMTVKEDDNYVTDAMAVVEARMILRACLKAKGQQSFLESTDTGQATMAEILEQEEIAV